jgi:hypothetical protein
VLASVRAKDPCSGVFLSFNWLGSPLFEVLNQVTTLISELARKDDISALFEQDEIIEHLEYSRRGLVNCRNYSLTREKKSEKFNIFERTI